MQGQSLFHAVSSHLSSKLDANKIEDSWSDLRIAVDPAKFRHQTRINSRSLLIIRFAKHASAE
jgi:hypothetical protein